MRFACVDGPRKRGAASGVRYYFATYNNTCTVHRVVVPRQNDGTFTVRNNFLQRTGNETLSPGRICTRGRTD